MNYRDKQFFMHTALKISELELRKNTGSTKSFNFKKSLFVIFKEAILPQMVTQLHFFNIQEPEILSYLGITLDYPSLSFVVAKSFFQPLHRNAPQHKVPV